MIKPFVFIVLLVAGLVSTSVLAKKKIEMTEILVEDQNMAVIYEDALTIFEDIGPVQKKRLAADRSKLDKLLVDLLGQKKKVKEAIKLGLDKEDSIRRKIEISKNNILVVALAERAFSNIKPPKIGFEEVAKEYYESHPEKYMTAEKVHAAHILIKVNNNDDDATKAKKLQLAKELLEKIKGGYSFETAAKKYSEDSGSADKGGDLGVFGHGEMVPEFEKAVFSLEKGEISDVVETKFGYHLIKLLEIIPQSRKSFELVKKDIIKAERDKYYKYKLEKYLSTFNADEKNTTLYIPVVEHLYEELKKMVAEEEK